MQVDEPMIIEGDPAKRFGVYVADIKGQPCKPEARFDTYDEVMGHCWRWDRKYLIEAGHKFLTFTDFVKQFDPRNQK